MQVCARYIISSLLGATTILAGAGLRPALAEVPQVVTDVPPVHALVQAVMGDLGQPVLLLDQGASVHDFQLRPSQMRALGSADLVVWVGPELTSWLTKPLEQRPPEAAVLELLADPGTERRVYGAGEAEGHDHAGHDHGDDHEGHDHAHDHGHDHAHDHDHGHDAGHEGHSHEGTDPHAWLDPHNGAHWVDLIAAELARLDPEHAQTYAANAGTAKAGIAAAEAQAADRLKPHAHAEIAVMHDAYGYFTGHFDLHPAESISLGDATAPGAQRLADLRAELAAEGIACIFPEAGHDPVQVAQLAEGTKVRIGAALDPEGRMLEPGAGLYAAILTGMADNIADCLEG